MASERKSLRGLILVEDKRQERFLRTLLRTLGFELRNFKFDVAPSGKGAAEAWVRKRYPDEVRVLRSKNFQQSLCLVAMRDGDAGGVAARKAELADELTARGYPKRGVAERISTPVPTWSIETWILWLLGQAQVTEAEPCKAAFPPSGMGERRAIEAAVEAWPLDPTEASLLPSLADGQGEFAKLSL